MNKELLQQKALEYARNHSSAPDKETPDWIITDYLAGANAMQEYADQEKRELEKENKELKDKVTELETVIAKLSQRVINESNY